MFPLRGGYGITVAKLVVELIGILLGTIIVDGVVHKVYLSAGRAQKGRKP